jgi:hypothetical protein
MKENTNIKLKKHEIMLKQLDDKILTLGNAVVNVSSSFDNFVNTWTFIFLPVLKETMEGIDPDFIKKFETSYNKKMEAIAEQLKAREETTGEVQ